MKLLAEASLLGEPPRPVSLAIGVFDGVHLGHAAVIRGMLDDARDRGAVPVVATFDRHPSAVVAPERTPEMIQPLWKRLEVLEAMGVETTLLFRFDAEFSRQPAGEFVARLVRGFGRLASISVGVDFVFGHRRSGNLAVLRELSAVHGFSVRGVEPVIVDGEPVSSTRVRECIAKGDFARARSLLGRPYALAGEVTSGEGIGRRIGFPTANLEVTGMVLPPDGVYAAMARGENLNLPAAVNIGRRPTVQRQPGPRRVEAHLVGYEGDLYGRRMELEFHRRIRGEQRFGSVEELTAQIARDVAGVRAWAQNGGLPAPLCSDSPQS